MPATPLHRPGRHNLRLSRTLTIVIFISEDIRMDVSRPDLTIHLGTALKTIDDSHRLQDRCLRMVRTEHIPGTLSAHHIGCTPRCEVWEALNTSYSTRFEYAGVATAIREMCTPPVYLGALWSMARMLVVEVIEKHEIMGCLTECCEVNIERPRVQETEAVLRRALADEIIGSSAKLLLVGIQARALGLDNSLIAEYERMGVEMSALVSRFLRLPQGFSGPVTRPRRARLG